MRNTLPLLLPATLLASLGLASAALPAQTGNAGGGSRRQSSQQQQQQQQQQPEQQQAAETPPADYTTERLSGVVVSSVDGKPIARVLVTSPDRRLAVLTDYEGRFSFDLHRLVSSSSTSSSTASTDSGASTLSQTAGAAATPLQFQLRKPGYLQSAVLLTVPASDPGAPQPPLQLTIQPAATIAGRVEPGGSDLPRVFTVQLRRKIVQNGVATWMPTGSVQVNSRGEFRFANLQSGDFRVFTPASTSSESGPRRAAALPDSVPGLAPAVYPIASGSSTAEALHVSPGETATVTLAPQAATFYRVTIPMANSGAAQAAGVSLLPDDPGLTLTYNNRDHSLEGLLPSGTYTARVTAFNPARGTNNGVANAGLGPPPSSVAVAHFEVSRAPVTAASLTPLAGIDLPVHVHLDFTPAQTTTVAPATTTPTQTAAAQVNLTPLDQQGAPVGNTPLLSTESEDDFSLRGVSDGVYRVQVRPRQGYVAALSSGTTDLLRDPLTVGTSAYSIEITLRDDVSSLTGTLLPNDPQVDATAAVSSIFILGIPLDRPQADPLQATAQQLRFEIDNVPPGRYLLLAAHRPLGAELEYRNAEILRDLMSQGAIVSVSPGQKADTQLPLLRAEAR